MTELFLAFLAQHSDAAWLRTLDRIEGAMHPVDRAATRIWFHLFPLALQRAMARPDAADLARRMTLSGTWRLSDQIDTSHAFLYGHQFWPHATRAVLDYAAGPIPPSSLDLGMQVQEAAGRVSSAAGVPREQVLGITAVAMRTLQQVGAEALQAAPGTIVAPGSLDGLTADGVYRVRERRRNRSFLRFLGGGAGRQSPVTFDERDPAAQFPLIHSQHLTTAAALDHRDHRHRDRRCSEGPIPVHCRSCSCGTCWIGILGGSEHTSPMESRERDKLAECGVVVEGPRPVMRLACMTQAEGPVSIVIPPWNGLVGRVAPEVRS